MKNKTYPQHTTDIEEDYLYSASYQDMTGLTPTPAHDEFEAESYQELAYYQPPVMPKHDQRPSCRHDYP